MGKWTHFCYVHWHLDMLQIFCKKINMHHLVNPWDNTISWVVQNTPEKHPRQKLLNPVFKKEDSRFRWRKPHLTWWIQLPMSMSTLNVLYRHILNLLLFLSLQDFYVLISLVPALTSRVILNDQSAQYFTTENIYFYVLC